MAGKRMIHDNIINSHKVNALSPWAEVLWMRLLTVVDDNGNYYADSMRVFANCLPEKKGATEKITKQAIQELRDVGLIVEYEAEERRYLHLVKFHKFQTLRRDRPVTVYFPTHPREAGPSFKQSGMPTSEEWAEFDETRTGFVYFVQADNGGPIKIGFSESPKDRLAALQVNTPSKLRLLAVIEGTNENESALHKRFQKHKIQGEWFRPDQEIMEFVGITTGETTGKPEVNHLRETTGSAPATTIFEVEVKDKQKVEVEGVRVLSDEETETPPNFRNFQQAFKQAAGKKPKPFPRAIERYETLCRKYGESEVLDAINVFVERKGGKAVTRKNEWSSKNYLEDEAEDILDERIDAANEETNGDGELPRLVAPY